MASAPLNWLLKIGGEALSTVSQTLSGAVNELKTLVNTKQDNLTFDNVPTANSDNPVKSNGIRTAIDDAVNNIDLSSKLDVVGGNNLDKFSLRGGFTALPLCTDLRSKSLGLVKNSAVPETDPCLFQGTHMLFSLGVYDTYISVPELFNVESSVKMISAEEFNAVEPGSTIFTLSSGTGVVVNITRDIDGYIKPIHDSSATIVNNVMIRIWKVYTSSAPNIKTAPTAFAEGVATTATGENSHAEGYFTKALGENTHAEGIQTKAFGKSSHAEGDHTNAYGNHSHVEGEGTEVYGAEQNNPESPANTIAANGHAEGTYTKVNFYSGHAEGSHTIAGDYTNRIGTAAHAEGYYTKAIEDYSHSEGKETQASGKAAHAEGENTTASGACSHAEGQSTTASGSWSHAGGRGVNATRNYSFVHGNYDNSSKKFRSTTMDGYGQAFGFDMSGAEFTADTAVSSSRNGCQGCIENTTTVTLDIEPQGIYLLIANAFTISSGALYGATVNLITGHGLDTGTPTNTAIKATSNAPATIATAANNKITIKNGAATRATQFTLIRVA